MRGRTYEPPIRTCLISALLLFLGGGGFRGLDPLAVFALDVVAFVRLGTDLFGAEFADLVDGGAFLLGDGGVNGLAVGVFGVDDLLVGVLDLDVLTVFVLHDFEVAGLVFADGAGLLEGFDLRLAFRHVLLDGGGVVSGGKRLRDGEREREGGDGESEQFFHGKIS